MFVSTVQWSTKYLDDGTTVWRFMIGRNGDEFVRIPGLHLHDGIPLMESHKIRGVLTLAG